MTRKTGRRMGVLLALIGLLIMVLAMSVNATTAKKSDQQLPIFTDLSANDVNANYVNYLLEKSIINGFDDGTFRPLEGLTRAQAAALLVRAAGITADASLAMDFTDVDANHWGKASIAAAARAGYIKGFPDNTFRPEEKLTRAQAAVMVLRLSKQKLDVADHLFVDLAQEHWAAGAAATAAAAGMMDCGSDGRQFQPDREMNRAEMARALAVLLTEDPQLYKAKLQGTIEVKKGTVSISKGQAAAVVVTAPTLIDVGDTIVTAANSEATITFTDGSGLLLQEKTNLTVSDAYGRSYIKQDGKPGVALEWLDLNMNQGDLFGVIPSSSADNADKDNKTGGVAFLSQFRTPLLASLGTPGLIAASNDSKSNPWYDTSKTKRSKVKVDMPWGVAAVRGTQFFIGQRAGGADISVLNGTVTATSHTAGTGRNEYDINGGQSARIGSTGSFTAPPAAMGREQLRRWVNAGDWIRERANEIQQNQEMNRAGSTPPGGSPSSPTPDNIPEDVDRALQEAQRQIQQTGSGRSSGGSSGSDSGPNSPYITSLEWTKDTQISVACGASYELPKTVIAKYSDGTSAAVSVSWNPSTVDTSIARELTFIGSVAGFADSIKLVLTVEPKEEEGVLGSYELKDVLVLDDYYYDNGVLTQEFSIKPSLAVSTRASAYELCTVDSYYPIIKRQGLDQPARVLKKLFELRDSLYIVFYDEFGDEIEYAALGDDGKLIDMANRRIAGKVILPEGMTAPAGGMDIWLYAQWNGFWKDVMVTIEEGQNEVDYSLKVVYNNDFVPVTFSSMTAAESPGHDYRELRNQRMQPLSNYGNYYRLSYHVNDDCDADLILHGWYPEDIDVTEGNQFNINLQLEKGQIISGAIKLPDNLPIDQDLYVSVEATEYSGEYNYYYDIVFIQADKNKADFSIAVPGQTDYQLWYYIFDQSTPAPDSIGAHLLRKGYYHPDGSVYDWNEAGVISVADEAVTNIDFGLIEGCQVYGTITLPEGRIASRDTNINIGVGIKGQGYASFYADYTLPQGGSSLAYSIVLPNEIGEVFVEVYADGIGEEKEINVGNEDVELNFAINLAVNEDLTPGDITGPALLIGEYAYNLNSLDFVEYYVPSICRNFTGYAYLKTADGLWFDLLSPAINAATALTRDNAINPDDLPPIYSKYDDMILRIEIREGQNDAKMIIFTNIPENTGVKIYDAQEGGNLLASATAKYSDGTSAAYITLDNLDNMPLLYYTFTPWQGTEQRRIPFLYPVIPPTV